MFLFGNYCGDTNNLAICVPVIDERNTILVTNFKGVGAMIIKLIIGRAISDWREACLGRVCVMLIMYYMPIQYY